jgi:hypothetical protein
MAFYRLALVLACSAALGCAEQAGPAEQRATLEPLEGLDQTTEARAACALEPLAVSSLPPVRFPDTEFARWALRIPGGFAGIWIENNELRFHLVDLGRHVEATDTLRAILQAQGRLGLLPSGFRAVKGAYDWLELMGCYALVTPAAFGIANVVSTDIDEKRNRIVVGASTEIARAAVRERLNGTIVPSRMVLVEHQEPAQLTARSRRTDLAAR